MNSIVADEPTEAAGAQRVLAFFREQFLLGRLKSGDRLQAERELSETLGVTRTVLREALRTLDNLGFLDIQYGKGTYVRNVDVAVLGDFLAFSLAQQPDIIDDIMQARVAIECQAIRLACTRATDGDFARIGGLLARLVETLDNADEGSASDYAFHLALVEASHSPALLTIYRSIRTILTGTHLEARLAALDTADIRRYLIDSRKEILISLLSRDADKAEEMVRQHFTIGDEVRRKNYIAAMTKTDIPAEV